MGGGGPEGSAVWTAGEQFVVLVLSAASGPADRSGFL